MIRTLFASLSPVPLSLAIAVLALASPKADAQTKPFLVAGTGSTPNGVSVLGADSLHVSTGLAFPIGPYTGDRGNFNSLSFDPMTLSGTFIGSFVFVDLFGNELFCTYGDTDNGAKQNGTYQLYQVGDGKVVAVFLAEFNPDPEKSTGRFKRAVDGSLIMLAVSEPFPFVVDENGFSPPWDYSWVGKGWLRFE